MVVVVVCVCGGGVGGGGLVVTGAFVFVNRHRTEETSVEDYG